MAMRAYPLSAFARRVPDSVTNENRVAHLLRTRGLGVLLPPVRVRDEHESRAPFAGSTDLRVYVDDPLDNLAIEVKAKNVRFSGRDDWPFDDVTLFAANKTRIPHAVVLYSVPSQAALAFVWDAAVVYRRDQTDGDPERNGLRYAVWAAPLASLRTFDEFVDTLKARLRAGGGEP